MSCAPVLYVAPVGARAPGSAAAGNQPRLERNLSRAIEIQLTMRSFL